jgi:peroxiredoxin Q/BCP
LRDRYSEFQERGAEVMAVAPDDVEHAREYFQSNEIPFPCLADPERKVFRQYDVKSAMVSLGQRPGLFVVDAEGIVRYAHLGWQQWEIPSVDETLEQIDRLSG